VTNDVIRLITIPEQKRKELVLALGRSVKRSQKLVERNSQFIDNITRLAECLSNPHASPEGFPEALKSTAKHLYNVEAHRKASYERTEAKLLNDFDVKSTTAFPKLKEQVETLLRDATRCIVAETKAKYSHNRANAGRDPGLLLTSSLKTTSNAELKERGRAWEVAMKSARVQEARRLKEEAIDRVNCRFSEAVKQRTDALYLALTSYININMIFHAKALEQLTEAYRCLHGWNSTSPETPTDIPDTVSQISADSTEEESVSEKISDSADLIPNARLLLKDVVNDVITNEINKDSDELSSDDTSNNDTTSHCSQESDKN
uniref:BAR domain-containing protein n=1 Tax=Ciona savignyi TaxID=51511 RepID=H2ZFV0_CIOSA